MPSSYTLGEHFESFVKQQVEGGRYNNASEVIRSALRLMEEREQERKGKLVALSGALEEGLSSGTPIPAADVLAELEQRYSGQ